MVRRYALALLLILTFTASAYAKEPYGFTVSFGYSGSHLNLKEKITPSVKDSGKIHGIQLNLSYKGKQKDKTSTFNDVSFTFQTSTIKYSGAVETLDLNNALIGYEPNESDVRDSVYNIKLKSGAKYALSDISELSAYGILGYRYFKRSFKDEHGYDEHYYWAYTGFGLGYDIDLTDKLNTGLTIEGVISPVKSKYLRSVTVDISKLDKSLNDMSLNFSGVYSYRIELPVSYKLSCKLSLKLNPFYEYWKADKTDTQMTNVAPITLEVPSSTTKNYGAFIGLQYKFK
jgi:hypothetical protein